MELDISCNRTSLTNWWEQTFHVCVHMDGASRNRSRVNPRYAYNARDEQLAYNIYTDAAGRHIVFSATYRADPSRIPYTTVTIPQWRSSANGKINLYVKVPVGQNVAAGTYTADFTQNSTTVYVRDSDCRGSTGKGENSLPFTLKADVVKYCKIDKPNNIDFGEKSVKDQNLIGQTNINVTCSKDHPYQIGLTSKYGDNKGSGKMKHITGSDTIDYSLRQSSSSSDLWGDSGNTAQTQGSRQFIGTGTQQGHAVYATISNIQPNVSAGEYRDTVTVKVYY